MPSNRQPRVLAIPSSQQRAKEFVCMKTEKDYTDTGYLASAIVAGLCFIGLLLLGGFMIVGGV